ncbi:DUF5694 domain-containing protein [Margalitia sp. FSL K6-0131]|uniref:DUF5694 domain-containing protein n=1 Tax=Margalitia sp. FSL K6-0131 TaxID=2954604 RepID=UPI0030F60F0E
MHTYHQKPKLLIVGTFHMGQTTDLFQTEVDNLLSIKRQQEIREVVDRLKKFHPTKLAVEVEKKHQDSLNEEYRQYSDGNLELKVNEVYQLGFRIASELEHKEIYCIDWMEQGAGKKGFGDVYEWAKKNQPELFQSIFGWLHEISNSANPNDKTILDMYRQYNEKEEIKQHHILNINIARIKEEEDYVGMDWLIWWYQRNLIMFSNLADLATSPNERILLIVGAAHVEILSNFIKECGLFELEEVDKYLYG